MNIVFAGTPQFSVPPLQALIDAGHRIQAVLTQPDRPAGRGRSPQPSPVKQLAVARGLPVFQPTTLKGQDSVERLRALAPDLMVVVAYGLLLPPTVLAIPRLGCINIHASLLPRWRGAAPIQRAIEAGDRETGVTIMQMEAGLDTGPILAEKALPIADGDTAGTLHDKLSALGAALLIDTLRDLEHGRIAPVPQEHARATYAAKLSKEEGRIDWAAPAALIVRRVRAFCPWPVAFTMLRGRLLRVLQAQAGPREADAQPGTVLAAGEDGILIAAGEGSVRIERLQLEGGKPLDAHTFLNGNRLSPGDRLG